MVSIRWYLGSWGVLVEAEATADFRPGASPPRASWPPGFLEQCPRGRQQLFNHGPSLVFVRFHCVCIGLLRGLLYHYVFVSVNLHTLGTKQLSRAGADRKHVFCVLTVRVRSMGPLQKQRRRHCASATRGVNPCRHAW